MSLSSLPASHRLRWMRLTALLTPLLASAWLHASDALPVAPAAASVSATGSAGANVAAAADSGSTSDIVKLDAIVSVGSRFNDRTVLDSPVAIDNFTADDLRDNGYPEITDVLQSLVPSFAFPRSTNVAGTALQRPATLRGLGPDQTLVLLDGKRRYPAAIVNTNGSVGRGSEAVDLNAIPNAAIGGVEILRDGASAQYGSDALAGVIDFTLRRDLGLEETTTLGQYYAGDGAEVDTSLNFGVPVGTRGGFLNTTLYYQDRGYTKRELPDLRQYYFGLDANGNPVQWSQGSVVRPATAPLPATHYDPREATVNREQEYWGDPKTNDRGIFTNSEIPINNAVTWYGFGGYSLRNGVNASSNTRPGDDANVRSIFPDGYVGRLKGVIEDDSYSTGVKGDGNGSTWDLSETWGRNIVDYYSYETVNPSYGALSPTSFYDGRLLAQQAITNLDLTHPVEVGLASPLKVAAGGEFRWDNYKIGQGDLASWQNGGQLILDGPDAGKPAAIGSQGFPGFRPGDQVDSVRHSEAGYLDFEQNLTDKLLLGLAGRAEDFSDAGSSFTGKIDGRYAFSPKFAIRASYGNGFRAPSLGQNAYTKTQQFGNTGNSGRTTAVVKTFQVDSPVAEALGAKPLKPEKSQSGSVGITGEILPNLTFSIDAYRTLIHDQIVLSSNFLSLAGNNSLGNFIAKTDPLSTNVDGVSFFTNGINSETHGVDLTTSYLWKLNALNRVTFTAGVNLNRNRITGEEATSPNVAAILGRVQPIFDATQQAIFERDTPRIRGNFSTNYTFAKKWTVIVLEQYYGITAAENTTTTAITQVYGAKWLTDANVTYHFSPRFSFTVGASNLFDVYPDKINGAIGNRFYDQAADPFGFNGGFYFTKFDYKL